MKTRLLKSIPKESLRLVSGESRKQPAVGDIGETDQCFAGPDGCPMVMVCFLAADGAAKWKVDAYETELEQVEPAHRPETAPLRTAAGGWLSRAFRAFLG